MPQRSRGQRVVECKCKKYVVRLARRGEEIQRENAQGRAGVGEMGELVGEDGVDVALAGERAAGLGGGGGGEGVVDAEGG